MDEAQFAALYQTVQALHSRLAFGERELKPSDTLSVRSDSDCISSS